MNLDERLHSLCQQGKQKQAKSLAQAAFTNEPIEEVVLDGSQVHVDMPRFHGVHRLTTDREGAADIRSQGEYTYKSDTVKLSFSTATMNQQAYDQAQAQLGGREETDREPTDDTQTPLSDSGPSEPETAATATDRTTTSPLEFLKGLL